MISDLGMANSPGLQHGLRMAPKRYVWSVKQRWVAVQLRQTQPSKSHDAINAAVHGKFG